jgi:hypothetical protein
MGDLDANIALVNRSKQTKNQIRKELRVLEESVVSPNDVLTDIIKEGWIYARKYGKPSFKRRYCVLNGDFLYFYKSEEVGAVINSNKRPCLR